MPRALMSAIGVRMTRRGRRTPARRARPQRGSKARLGPSAKDLVIVSRALADLAEFLRTPQESTGRGHVILDRRLGERRGAALSVEDERRRRDRRQPPPSAQALMEVLGFMVVPAGKPPIEPSARGEGGAVRSRPPRAAPGCAGRHRSSRSAPPRLRRPAARHRPRTPARRDRRRYTSLIGTDSCPGSRVTTL